MLGQYSSHCTIVTAPKWALGYVDSVKTSDLFHVGDHHPNHWRWGRMKGGGIRTSSSPLYCEFQAAVSSSLVLGRGNFATGPLVLKSLDLTETPSAFLIFCRQWVMGLLCMMFCQPIPHNKSPLLLPSPSNTGSAVWGALTNTGMCPGVQT